MESSPAPTAATNCSIVIPSLILVADGRPFGDPKKRKQLRIKWNLMDAWSAYVGNAIVISAMYFSMDHGPMMSLQHCWREVPNRILAANEPMVDFRDSASTVHPSESTRRSKSKMAS
eukprot:scaffold16800_cov129-Cylindrotheca_fusiformis.AAC.5